MTAEDKQKKIEAIVQDLATEFRVKSFVFAAVIDHENAFEMLRFAKGCIPERIGLAELIRDDAFLTHHADVRGKKLSIPPSPMPYGDAHG